MRMTKRILSLALMLVLLAALCVPVLAADNSLTVTMKGEGGSVKIYKVAERTTSTFIEPVSDFAFDGFPTDLEPYAKGEKDIVELAKDLLEFAENEGISALSTQSVADLKVSFTGLDDGIYLVASDEEPDRYSKITPFIIDLPHMTKDDSGKISWESSMTVEAKMTPITPAKYDPPIEKMVTPNWAGKNESFTFTMTPDDKSYPMPDPQANEYPAGSTASINTSTNAMTLTLKGPGSVEFGWMYYYKAGTYTYEVKETAGSSKGWTYDKTIYKLKVVVTKDGEKLTAKETITDSKGNPVTKMSFTNKYEEPEKKVPQTGQLWWPVAVMGIGGVALIAVGAVLRKKREDYDRY